MTIETRFKKLTRSFAVVAGLVHPAQGAEPQAEAPDLLWQYPRKVISNEQLGTTTYLFDRREHKGVLTIESGYADRRTGVVCQLTQTGKSGDGETFGEAPTVRKDCAVRPVPDIWKEPQPRSLQSQARLITVRGYFEQASMRGVETTQTFFANGSQDSELRRWDLAKGEVCLYREVGRYVAAPLGTFGNPISKSEKLYRLDLGCYPIRGNAGSNFLRRYKIGEPA